MLPKFGPHPDKCRLWRAAALLNATPGKHREPGNNWLVATNQEAFLRSLLHWTCFGLAAAFPGMARAQATSNAITGANDAFGFRQGDEAVGIYDESSARGFKLESAGNYRVQGTYFVKNSGVSSFFLESTSVRIGFNTMPVTFPSPSGVVDYKLRDPAAGEPSIATVGLDVFEQPYAEVLFKHRAPSGIASGAIGISYFPERKDPQGGSGGSSILIGGTARYSPGSLDARIFGGEFRYESPSTFRFVTSDDLLRKRVRRSKYLGVKDLNDSGQRRIAGLLADVAVNHKLGLGVTTVFSQEDPTKYFLTLFGNLGDDGTVDTTIISSPAQRTTSLSSELRAYWTDEKAEDRTQRIDAVVRLRRTRTRFGGATVTSLGRTLFEVPLEGDREEFEPSTSAELRDRISQVGAGLAYRAVLGPLRLNAGLLGTRYRKLVSGPEIAENELITSAWLYNLSAAYRVGEAIEIYGGFSRGLEEAGVAPSSASNRDEVLPAAPARQREIAAVFRAAPDFKVVVGAFDLRRGYFGSSGAGRPFGKLGTVQHRGLELSASGRVATGLTVIAGGVLLDPRVRTAAGSGIDDFRPVGVPSARLLASADYQLPGTGIHLDGSVQFTSRRKATLDRDAEVESLDPTWTVNAGLRSPLKLGLVRSTVRLQVLNLLNEYSWVVSTSGTMTYSPARHFRLALTTEL